MLTGFQRRILRLLKDGRSQESAFAGGSMLNADRARLSFDLDIFNDKASTCALKFAEDVGLIRASGLGVDILRTPERNGIGEVSVFDGEGRQTVVQWAVESAFRFFPATFSEECGFVLDRHDLGINKCMCLVDREKIRDYFDVCLMIRDGMPVPAYFLAVPGKDPGWPAEAFLEAAMRGTRHSLEEFEAGLSRYGLDLDIRECRRVFHDAVSAARRAVASIPPEFAGCLFIREDGEVFLPSDEDWEKGDFAIHGGRPYGSIPEFPGAAPDLEA